MEGMLAKNINVSNDKNAENRRKSALIVKSEDNHKSKYNYLKHNLKPNDSRSDAITELELIYDKLNEELLDSELLDRAERRDLPYSHQLIWANDHNNNNVLSDKIRLNSDENDLKVRQMNASYESFNKRRSMATIAALEALRNDYKSSPEWMSRSRTPPYRRSVIPDIVRDDFAFRKYNKSLSHSYLASNPEISGFNSIKRINANKHYSMSYLLTTCSDENIVFNDTNDSIYTNDNDLKYLSKANIKVDDLSNRWIRQSSAQNVLPPHPPFGIPNTIVSHSTANDYIRAELNPKEANKVRFRSKSSVPHLIRDDMAYRSLRKDNSRGMPLPLSSTITNHSLPNISEAHRMSSRV